MTKRAIPEPAGRGRHGWCVIARDGSAGVAIVPVGRGWRVGGHDEAAYCSLAEAARVAGRRMCCPWRLVHQGVEVFVDAT